MKFLALLLLFVVSCADNKKTEQEKIIATYNIKPELFWFQQYGLSDIITSPEYSSTIYYDILSNNYYFATIEKTNNIIYNTNNIINENATIHHIPCWGAKPNKQDTDLVYYPIQDPLIYIGSIDLTNRIYIDSKKNQYIKNLTKIDTSYYIDYENHKKELKGSLFPYLDHNNTSSRIALSNEFNQSFVFGNLRPDPNISNQYPYGTLYLKYYD